MTETTETTRKELKSHLLGEVVAWELSNPKVPYASVLKALNDADISQDYASDLSYKSAFSRACKELKKDRAIDKVKTDGIFITFQFTKKFLEDSGRMEFDFECEVILDTDTGHVSCPSSLELQDQAQTLLHDAINTRTSSDVSRTIQKIFTDNGDLFPIVPSKGGSYFCPEECRPFTDKVEVFLRSVGGKLCRFPVPQGTEHGNASVRDAVADGLQSLITEMNDTVESWDMTTRDSTMDKIATRWNAISHKVEAYEHYLGAALDALRVSLTDARERLHEKIVSVETDKASERSTKKAVAV